MSITSNLIFTAQFTTLLEPDVAIVWVCCQTVMWWVLYGVDCHAHQLFQHEMEISANRLELAVQREKQRAHKEEMRLNEEKQAAEKKALQKQALLQQQIHEQEIQRREQARVNARLTNQIATLDSFKSVFDHQLKNYFLSIGTTAEICMYRDTLNANDRSDLELIVAASNLGVDVCYDQQVLRDITADCYQLKPSATCIHALLKHICARQVRLLNEADETVIMVDSNLTSHCVNNAVSNAAKYGSKMEKPTCVYEIDPDHKNLQIVIENQRGDHEQHQSLLAACNEEGKILFTAARSTLLPQAANSSGFGSTIIHRCSCLMSGTCFLQVSAESTKFVLQVPIAPAQEQSSAMVPADDEQVPLLPVSNLKFAVVDDHQLVARVCTKQIQALFGCQCLWLPPEGTLAEMMARIENEQPDILFVDNDLGDFGSGAEVLKRLKALTCTFNGLAISYSGDETDYKPSIPKSARGQLLASRVQELWSAFVFSKPLARKRILLVDDKDLHVHLETKLLHKERAVPTRFRDGSELLAAVEQITTQGCPPWDAIILDQTMVTLDGLPTLERLPAAFKKQVPIIMYSTEDGVQDRCVAAGAVQYLEKRPGSHQAIVQVLKTLIGGMEQQPTATAQGHP